MRIVFKDKEMFDPPYFWTLLGQQGRRVVVIDADLAGLQQQANGIHIAGWQTHDTWMKFGSSPPELTKEVVLKRFGREPLGLEDLVQGRPRRQAAIRAQLLRSVQRRTGLLLHFLQNELWDFFLAAFPEPHRAGHQLWGFPENGGTVRQETSETPGTALKDVYRAVDTAVSRLLASLPEDVYVLAYSSKGMGPRRGSVHHLGPLLQRLDAVLAALPSPQQDRAAKKLSVSGLLRSLHASLPATVMNRIAPLVPQYLKTILRHQLTAGGVDWSQTRFLSVPTDGLGFVRLNIRGREAQGAVEPGDELETLIQEVSKELSDWEDMRTGMPIVGNVWRTSEVFSGPRLAELPDLMVEWGRPLPTDLSRAPRVGVLSGRDPERRGGGHTFGGFLLARGPGVQANSRLPEVNSLDIPPTIFRLLGLPPHESFEGKPIADLLSSVS
jgi:predicted AlkP superfamily phosphohydrolase/phosphomutase